MSFTVLNILVVSALLKTEQMPFVVQTVELPHIQHALELKHKDRSLSGGFSALWISKDCKQSIFISDYSQVSLSDLSEQPVQRSKWFVTDNKLSAEGAIVEMNVIFSDQLKGLDGNVLLGAAESIVWDDDGFLLSLDDRGDLFHYALPEQSEHHLYKALTSKPTVKYQQPQLGKGNAGLESLTKLSDGTILSIWEKYRTSDTQVPMILIDPARTLTQLQFAPVSSPKDVVTLTSGKVMVLEKDWLGKGGSRLRLSEFGFDEHLGKSTFYKGSSNQVFQGKTLFDHTSTDYDNFEGMATCTTNNEEWVYLVSDDNGDWHTKHFEEKGINRQRTLFVGFKLSELLATKKD